jgi:hypothetical protein
MEPTAQATGGATNMLGLPNVSDNYSEERQP